MIANLSQRLIVLFAFGVAPVGVLAPKGAVVLLAVAGLVGVARWVAEGFRRLPLSPPFVMALVVLALWAAISAAWAIMPESVLALVLRLTMLGVAGAGLLYGVSRLDAEVRETAENGYLAGIAVGLVALTAGFVWAKATGVSLWDTYLFDPLTTLNNGAVAISLLAWPAFAIMWRRRQLKAFSLVAVMVYFGFLFLSSGAALLAPAGGLAGFAIVWIWRRPGARALGAIVAVLVLAAPLVITFAQTGERVDEVASVLPASARHRLAMWAFAVEKIEEKPLWGWGMDASRAIPQDDRRLAPNMEIMPLHPHNAFLQIRLELGVPGVIITATLVYLFFSGLGVVGDRFSAAVMTGAGGAYLTVASVSYGIWQNWWLAFAWSLAAMMVMALAPPAFEEGD